ncbi:MAG: hypothetical protein P1U89_00820 [Verrucomicrobiales bacterium]|nr:hypothetical protein [Verrucomicrobiales bacterium]
MLNFNYQAFLLAAEIRGIPNWVVFASVALFLIVGVLVGRAFWRQFRGQAVMIEDEVRRAQSEFDLVSRDLFRTKQEALSHLESRNQKV